jgi:hypothetical protein
VTLADGGRAFDCSACCLPLKPPIFQVRATSPLPNQYQYSSIDLPSRAGPEFQHRVFKIYYPKYSSKIIRGMNYVDTYVLEKLWQYKRYLPEKRKTGASNM